MRNRERRHCMNRTLRNAAFRLLNPFSSSPLQPEGCVPPLGFKLAMRGTTSLEGLDEPAQASNRSLLGKAALKTHSLQTLTSGPLTRPRAKPLECVRFIGAFSLARDGQWFMVAT